MASVDSSWTPPPAGTYDVSVGQSLSRALKARKGEPVRSKVERELYSFRYNFRPESVDTVANGTITIQKGDDKDLKVSVERASQTEPAGCSFVGTAPAAKEFDCVIIFDPQTMSFTMEKVDSSVLLVYDRKTSHVPRKPSPLPPSSATSSRPSTSSSTALASHAPSRSQLLRQPIEEAAGLDEDAEGEIDEDFLDVLPVVAKVPPPPSKKSVEKDKTATSKGKQAVRKFKAEPLPVRAEEESEPEEALSKQVKGPPPLPTLAPKPKAPPKRQKKSAPMTKAEKAAAKLFHNFPKPRQVQLPSQPAPPGTASAKPASAPTAPPPPSAAGTKRERDVEPPVVDAPRAAVAPPPRAKRQKVQPALAPPKPEKLRETFSLALPGSEFSLPSFVSAPVTLAAVAAASSGTAVLAAPVPDQPAAPPEDSDSDGGWDEVVPTGASAPTLSMPVPPAPQPVRSIQMEVIIPTSEPDVQDSDGLAAGDDDFLQDMFDEAGDAEAEDEAIDDDFLQDAMIEESTESQRAPPKSMNELAQAELGDLWPDDDDDDTSDESESDDE